MLNGVMSMNSCRVVLIALLMLVCGSGSLFAQIKTGDIVTICYETTRNGQTTYNYLAINDALNGVERITTPSENCLWVLEIIDGKYTFKSVINQTKYLQVVNGTTTTNTEVSKPTDHKLLIANNPAPFDFEESNSGTFALEGNVIYKQTYYTRKNKNEEQRKWKTATLKTYISYSNNLYMII
jgi:hypothetical protein